ncbi:hypothetical protein R1sor_014118 [Riccia sorocarpa]|uniref:Endonuclease/exonuclease/phosphatase domain-containing protein n=1 Tax=Riccia sorocarpa TaxID=122646 RepID=A0ABD3HBD8_9MARC
MENVVSGLPSLLKTSKQVEEATKLLTTLFSEVGNVKSAIVALRTDVQHLQKRLDISTSGQVDQLKSEFSVVETWEWRNTVVELPGFSEVAVVWNPRRVERGRGFGGIRVWVKQGNSTHVEVELIDEAHQFVVLRLHGKKPSFLIVSYFAPHGSPVYENADTDPFMCLTSTVVKYQELGLVWLVSDFNSRVSNGQNTGLGDDGAGWRTEVLEATWPRESEDREHNRFAEMFYV